MTAVNARTKSRPSSDILPHAKLKSAAKLSLLHTPAPAKPHVFPLFPLRRLTTFARRVSRGTPRLVDPHIAATRAAHIRAHSCELARAKRRGSKSNDCGARPLESTRETRSGDDPRAARSARGASPLPPHRSWSKTDGCLAASCSKDAAAEMQQSQSVQMPVLWQTERWQVRREALA